MSVQSDAAKKHIESLFAAEYPDHHDMWMAEFPFSKLDTGRKWRFDYADFVHRCAIELDGGTFQAKRTGHASGTGLRAWREKNNAAMAANWRVWHYAPEEIIRAGRKRNGQMQPESERINKARKTGNAHKQSSCVTLPDEPILKCLPWLEKREVQKTL